MDVIWSFDHPKPLLSGNRILKLINSSTSYRRKNSPSDNPLVAEPFFKENDFEIDIDIILISGYLILISSFF